MCLGVCLKILHFEYLQLDISGSSIVPVNELFLSLFGVKLSVVIAKSYSNETETEVENSVLRSVVFEIAIEIKIAIRCIVCGMSTRLP